MPESRDSHVTRDRDLERVVRDALAPDGSASSSVSDAVEAVVKGRGEASQLGQSAPFDAVLFDTDAIGRWVFESSRPPVVEGASTILRELNGKIARHYEHRLVFSAGGEGLLLAPAGEGEAIRREVERWFERESAGGLSVTTVCRQVQAADFVGEATAEPGVTNGVRLVTGTQAVLARLRDDARRIKDEQGHGGEVVDGSRKRCVSCRDRAGELPAERFRKEDLADQLLCRPCDRRWEVGRRRIEGVTFDELTESFQDSLPDGVATAARSRYLGFLYADGNGMGAAFGRLGSLAGVRELSGAVDRVFRRVRELVDRRLEEQLGRWEGKAPRLEILGGGDETIWIAPGALAVDLALHLDGWLAEATAAEPAVAVCLGGDGAGRLSVGAGLVLAGVGLPVRYQHDLAKRLQASAKRLYYAAPERATSAVDFEVITDGEPLIDDLETARSATYGTREPGFSRTRRPYSSTGFASLCERVRAAGEAGIGSSQLRGLLEGAEDGEAVFLNFVRYQVARVTNAPAYTRWLARSGVDPGDRAALDGFFVGAVTANETGRGDTAEPRRGIWLADALELEPFLRLADRLGGRDAVA